MYVGSTERGGEGVRKGKGVMKQLLTWVGEAVVPEEGHFLEIKKIKIPPHFFFFRSFLKKVKTGEVENGEVFYKIGEVESPNNFGKHPWFTEQFF